MQSPFPRRFLFRGSATGISGYILRRHDTKVDHKITTYGSISLPITGGRSLDQRSAHIERDEDGQPIFSVERVKLEAIGEYVDPGNAAEFTHGNHSQNDVATRTTVTTEIDDLKLFVNSHSDQPMVEIASIRATWISDHPNRPHKEPTIEFRPAISGLRIDGKDIGVKFGSGLLAPRTYGELKKLWKTKHSFRKEHAHLFGIALDAGDTPDPGGVATRFPDFGNAKRGEVTLCTIVSGFEGTPTPDVEFAPDGHTIRVKDFGTIHFGEMILTSEDRRATLLRMDIGSDKGGGVGVGGGGTDGGTWPP